VITLPKSVITMPKRMITIPKSSDHHPETRRDHHPDPGQLAAITGSRDSRHQLALTLDSEKAIGLQIQ
jgi:hypothetical protein